MQSSETIVVDLRTDKAEYLDENEVYHFFVPPEKDMQTIVKIKNTFIVGHKGTGKTNILRYMSHPLQKTRRLKSKPIDFDSYGVGIFMRCDVGRFGGFVNKSENIPLDAFWIKQFTHIFNLCALLPLLDILDDYQSDAKIKVTKKETQKCIKKINSILRLKTNSFIPSSFIRKIDNEIYLLKEDFQKNNTQNNKRHHTDFRFLYEIRQIIKDTIPYFKKKELFFLLDEYSELSNEQQQVINDMLKLRHPIFKMSCLPYGYIRERINSKHEIDIDQDFDIVTLGSKSLTPNSIEIRETKNFFAKVWNNRIKTLSLPIPSIDLLLESPTKNRVGKQTKKRTKSDLKLENELQYTGFTNYVLLSSRNPKSFLDLLQATIDKACENNIDLQNAMIPTSIQLDAIRQFSNERRNDIVTAHSDMGQGLSRLVETVGNSLKTKNNKTKWNYRLVGIKHMEKLSNLSSDIIALGLQKSVLMQTDFGRISRNERIRLQTFSLNNLLLPSFELPISSQQILELDALYVDTIIMRMTTVDDVQQQPSSIEAKEDQSTSKQIPIYAFRNLTDINKLLAKDDLILFIGAGISAYAGLPTASYLTDMIKKELGLQSNSTITLPKVARLFVARKSSPELIAFVKEEFDKINPKNLDLHDKIASLNISRIITTNWDSLIEDMLKSKGVNSQVIVDPDELNVYDEKKSAVFKMHGDFSHRDYMVITENQYNDYAHSHKSMLIRIKALLQNHGALFIGYGLNDYNFKEIRNEVMRGSGSLKRSYAIFRDIEEDEITALNDEGITVIKSDFKIIINHLCDS